MPRELECLNLPPFRRTQALASSTFRLPPLDGSLTIPELYDWHYKHSPHHPLFMYSDDDGVVATIDWAQATKAMHRAGRRVAAVAQQAIDAKRPIFAILSGNDSITYYTLIAGICRAGFTAFPISPRNSASAVAHLLKQTDVSHLIVSDEPAIQELAEQALGLLDNSKPTRPMICAMPLFEDLYVDASDCDFEFLPPMNVRWDDTMLIVHSSGSTAFPKPIVWTHERYFLTSLVPCFGERDLTGQRLAFHSVPMFHGLGMMQIGWTAFCGLVLTVFKPQSPPQTPTPESVMKAAMDTRSDYILCVPSFVEAWANDTTSVRNLQRIQGLIFGGGPLSQGVGDELVSKSVSIFPVYGITETGVNNIILPKKSERDCQYFAFGPHVKPHFIPDGDGHFELVIVSSEYQKPSVINTTVNGIDAYATNDLLVRHPSEPSLWRIYGRADDQIMHSTGEKTNPGPLETILSRDPHIQAAIIFGRGRFNAGVLIDPSEPYKLDPNDHGRLAEFRNRIWPSIENMNAYAPQQSRIFKEMIIVSSPGKPFTYTAKNTARRQAIIYDYAPEIEALYRTVAESMKADLVPPASWSFPHVLDFVRSAVRKVFTVSVDDTEDLFRRGCNSLQATWIRNSVLHALRDSTKLDIRLISNNILYDNPSVFALATFLSTLAQAETPRCTDKDKEVQRMLDLVHKYTSNFPVHEGQASLSKAYPRDVVLLSGTTGGFGSSLLSELVQSPHISLIYALNRKEDKPILERQRTTLEQRELSLDILHSPKLVLLESNMCNEKLGLSDDMYEELRSTITHIIHNGWSVNFNTALEFFEPSVAALRNLMDLALLSPREQPTRLLFVSSIGVVARLDRSEIVQEEEVPPLAVVGSGYAESKWVAEKLCSIAAERTALRPICVRVGQICGSDTGAWNPSEWLPSLIRSSVHCLRYLPSRDLDIAMLPANDAAKALLEMRNADARFLHLVHPRPTPWSTIMEPVAKEFGLPSVPFDEWVSLLTKSGEGLDADHEVQLLQRNPALKLLQFFTQCSSTGHTQRGIGVEGLDMSKALAASATLRSLLPVSGEHTQRWISYWKRHGFL